MDADSSLGGDDSVSALIWPVLSAWSAGALALLSGYVRGWILSGSAIQTLLLLSGPSLPSDVPSWALVLCLNIVYGIASTSWLLHIVFASLCWPLVLATLITQYVLISRFTRGRLRWLLKEMHFHRDKVAFFSFPVLIIDTGISGFVAVQGVTVSILTLTIEVHSIDLALSIGQGHEIHAHTNSLEIKLFRRIAFGEIFAAHKCLEDERETAFEADDEDVHVHNKFHEPSADRIAKDNVDHETSTKHGHRAASARKAGTGESVTGSNHSTALDDEDAELKYTHLLDDIHTGGRLYQMRERLKAASPDREHTDPESIELRAILCTELRRTGLSPPEKGDRITTSKLATLFPEPDIFQYVPSAMRALLWLASHTHPMECPSISVAGSGHWLNDLLAQLVFRRHSTDDERIVELEREISEWLSVGEYCLDLRNITASGQVPMRSTYNIKSEIRSTGIAISRVDVESESSTQMASLAGVDGTFVIPICLLPRHSHLIPPEPSPMEVKAAQEEKKREEAAEADEARTEEETAETTKPHGRIVEPRPSEDQLGDESEEEPEDLDALGVLMSIRATLPAHFDESCLSFAATLSKAAQMLDIEESIVDPPTPMPYDENLDPTDSFREKFSRRSKQLGSVMKHPLQTAQGAFHREMRKATVMRVNGAWFAKWTNKILEQLAWLNGDVGYTFEIPVSLKPYR